MAGAMGRFAYHADDGNVYTMRLDASNAATTSAVASAPGVQFPKGWQPRYVLAQHPTTRRERKIVITNPTNAIWTGTGGTMNLPDYDADPVANAAYLILGRVGERRYARA